jgi:hypothetical protein
MESPFPGMDPFLETRWSDVHVRLIAYIGEALQPLLPPDLRARSEERVLLESADGQDLTVYRSDIAVVDAGGPRRPAAGATGHATVEPVLIDIQPGPRLDRFVQIIDTRRGNRVVTVIEVVSPWNKAPGRLNREYRRKVEDYASAGVSLVEIDLLRGSRDRLEVGQQDLPPGRRAPYLACVRRAGRPARWEVYPLPLRQPLPSVPVPLREKESDVLLDLQPLIHRVYSAGGHDDIDYRRPPEPPLEDGDEEWADGLLRAASRR